MKTATKGKKEFNPKTDMYMMVNGSVINVQHGMEVKDWVHVAQTRSKIIKDTFNQYCKNMYEERL